MTDQNCKVFVPGNFADNRRTPTPNGPYDPPLPPNDPGPESLFVKISETKNECSICGERMFNSTEARDGHLNRKSCHV